jgi:RimJ/RimL family protein N-acetyltransferase
VSVVLALPRSGHVLREYREDDVPRLCSLADDAEVWRGVTDLFPRPYDEAAARRWLARQRGVDPPCNLVLAGPEGLMGGVGVVLADVPNFAHDGELGYWVGRPYWGRGLATAAVRAFMAWAAPAHGLSRFTVRAFGNNPASVRVAEKCGFRREGVLRQAARKHGETFDLFVYGLVI